MCIYLDRSLNFMLKSGQSFELRLSRKKNLAQIEIKVFKYFSFSLREKFRGISRM